MDLDYKNLFSAANWTPGQLVSALDLIRTSRAPERSVYHLLSLLTAGSSEGQPTAVSAASALGLNLSENSATEYEVSPGVAFVTDDTKQGDDSDPLIPEGYRPVVVGETATLTVSVPGSFPRVDVFYGVPAEVLDTSENRAVKSASVENTALNLRTRVSGSVLVSEGTDGSDLPTMPTGAVVPLWYLYHDTAGVRRLVSAKTPLEIGPTAKGVPPAYMCNDHVVDPARDASPFLLSLVSGTTLSVAPGNVVLQNRTVHGRPVHLDFPAAVTEPRIDLVSVDTSGLISVTQGVEGGGVPATPSGSYALWEVPVAVGSVTADFVGAVDKRRRNQWLRADGFSLGETARFSRLELANASGVNTSVYDNGQWAHTGNTTFSGGTVLFTGDVESFASILLDGGSFTSTTGTSVFFDTASAGTFGVEQTLTAANLVVAASGAEGTTLTAKGRSVFEKKALFQEGFEVDGGSVLLSTSVNITGDLNVKELNASGGVLDLGASTELRLPDTITLYSERTTTFNVPLGLIAAAMYPGSNANTFQSGVTEDYGFLAQSTSGAITLEGLVTFSLPVGAKVTQVRAFVGGTYTNLDMKVFYASGSTLLDTESDSSSDGIGTNMSLLTVTAPGGIAVNTSGEVAVSFTYTGFTEANIEFLQVVYTTDFL